ncbi:MAG: indole-3-glycerol phosphate synthase TrpC [Erysipelotrichaceae bacterium]
MILDNILKYRHIQLNKEKAEKPLATIKASTRIRPHYNFKEALINNNIAVIAEIKQASPSLGKITDSFNYINIAKDYEEGKANAISILTEEKYFRGNRNILEEIGTFSTLPILRKDFIVDEYQIYDAYIMGADAILLIASVLSYNKLLSFYKLAKSLKLDVVLEVHSLDEYKTIASIGAEIIGINNRDLTSFNVDVNTSIELARIISKDTILVSESGISSSSVVKRLSSSGFNAILVGEALMLSKDKTKLIKELKNEN